MNAAELLQTLAGLQDTREVAASDPVMGSVEVAGVEVARIASARETDLRRAWRERHAGAASPLVVLADAPNEPECGAVLGPSDGAGPVRTLRLDALLDVLANIAGQSRLAAVRTLASELDRLDQSGVPGLRVHGLLTQHTLSERLRRDAGRWGQLAEATTSVSAPEWRELLTNFGYELERRPQRGWLARYEDEPVLVVHPYADAASFSRLDEEGRPPEGLLVRDCRLAGAPYGLLAAGAQVRLFEADGPEGGSVSRYLELDAARLPEDYRPLVGLVAPAWLAQGRFEELRREARDFGAGLRERLDEQIREEALPALASSLGAWAQRTGLDVTDDDVRLELEHAALNVVFRALFLLYAESAGYLPVEHPTYRAISLTQLVDESVELDPDPRSTTLWSRFQLLVRTMRTGDTARGVPAYNGALFAADGFDGAHILERAELTDPDVARLLVSLGRDPERATGTDYSSLAIGHLGHIYEGLLSLRLSVADRPLRYDRSSDRYVTARASDEADALAGEMLWQTHEGGRKRGGVYYTREELVAHLVRGAVVPQFEDHLAKVREVAATDPEQAASELFGFAVLDPACGSAHFLVSVSEELADMVVTFLADQPLPAIRAALNHLRAGASPGHEIGDTMLLRRLVLKRCVYGVDVSRMGAEIAKLSLWLASFVPGLSLAYLDHNIQVGDSLVGIARPERMRPPGSESQAWFLEEPLKDALTEATEAARQLAEIDDRNPTEVEQSAQAHDRARAATTDLVRLFDLWTAAPFGVEGARDEVINRGPEILVGADSTFDEAASEIAEERSFLHWPIAFAEVFARGGFDAVVGNPPWEEVTVEELAFYARFRPGLRGLPAEPRNAAVADLLEERPELETRLREEQEASEEVRAYLGSQYETRAGDPDLYKFFCQRYRDLLADGGRLGVVLPRSTFVTKGSADFRSWLFEDNATERIDFLLNTGRWAFDSEPRYTVALVVSRRDAPGEDHRVQVAGTAASLDDWLEQAASPGLALPLEVFGPDWMIPLLRNQDEVELLTKMRQSRPFPYGGGRWMCFPVRELDETLDRHLWEDADDGLPLWKGESFDQYDPHGAEARVCPPTNEALDKVRKPRPGAGSLLTDQLPVAVRRRALLTELDGSRVAFRDVARSTDTRTVRACVVPPEVFLTNKAPYLVFVEDQDADRAACLGVLNSLPFDWQARRFVEINLNFFILEGLAAPSLSDEAADVIARAAGRLSCVDERFSDFAESLAFECGPLDDDERLEVLVEIDARVALAYGMSLGDLDVMLADFTDNAASAEHRQRLRGRLRELLGS